MRSLDGGGQWFVMSSGDRAGQPHMKGWGLTAIKGESTGPHDDGWLSLGVCPRCHAVVITDDKHAFGDQQWAHEAWHAETDHPIPDEMRPGLSRAQVSAACRRAGDAEVTE